MLEQTLPGKPDVWSPMPKEVWVWGLDDKFENFEFKGITVRFKPLAGKPSMFDGPWPTAVTA